MSETFKGTKPSNKKNIDINIITYQKLQSNELKEIDIERLVPINLRLNSKNKKVATFPEDWTNQIFHDWDCDNSVAVKTGNGIVVIDIDTKEFEHLDESIRDFVMEQIATMATFIVVTTNGYHLYYKSDKEYSSNTNISPKIDVRAEGGCAFICSIAKDITYSLHSNAPMANLPIEFERLLKLKGQAITFDYGKDGLKYRTEKRNPNPALYNAVSSGDIERIIKTTGMERADFVEGQMYVKFNRFAFILANEPSIHNENVENILKLLVEDVLKFDWNSPITQKHINQSLSNMVWAPVYIEPKGIEIYLLGDKYIVIDDGHPYNNLTKQTALTHWTKAGKDKDDFIKELVILKAVEYNVDYFNPSEHILRDQVLTVITNPTYSWQTDIDIDENVINDYENKVLNGQLKKLVRVIIWSMRMKENKLNKLLLVGESNKGKTEFARLLGFAEMSAKDFVKILNSDRKWSKSESERLLSCGLLLADDIIHDLPLSIKNVSDTITLDIMYSGHTVHPMKFMLMTSTHSSVISTMNDELKNRILIMEIGGKYTFNDSPYFQKDPKKYREHTEAYIKKLILTCINEDFSSKEFRKLQDELRAPKYNERDEILEMVREQIINAVRVGQLVVTHYKKHYAIKRKNDLKKLIIKILRQEFDDHRIDLTKETAALLNEFISDKRNISINDNGMSEKYYEVFIEIENDNEDFDELWDQ